MILILSLLQQVSILTDYPHTVDLYHPLTHSLIKTKTNHEKPRPPRHRPHGTATPHRSTRMGDLRLHRRKLRHQDPFLRRRGEQRRQLPMPTLRPDGAQRGMERQRILVRRPASECGLHGVRRALGVRGVGMPGKQCWVAELLVVDP